MNIFVGNLAFSATDDSLRQLFESHGVVDKVNIITDRDTGRSKGFGFVEMPDSAAAKAAIQGLNGKELDGRALTVNEAKPREPRREPSRSRWSASEDGLCPQVGGAVCKAVHERRPSCGVVVAVGAPLASVIFCGHTSSRPNQKPRQVAYVLSSSRYEDTCHHSRVYLAAQRRRPRCPVADLRPRCPASLERFFARPAEPAGIFQHSPGEFHVQNFPVLPAGVAAVTFDTGISRRSRPSGAC